MGNSSSAAAANESNSTFDEAMCKRFNAFYDVVPLPDGRVRPKFKGSEHHLALVAHLNYTSYKTDYINYVQRDQMPPEVHTDFINLFAQFEQFPTPLAGCFRDMNLKQLKQTNPVEFNKVQAYDKMTDKKTDAELKFTLIMCKLKFLGFIIEYVTNPVVLEWDTYMKKKQGQPLSVEDENDLSSLLQIKLLEGMDTMIEMTKGNVIVEYVATQEENEHYETFKNNLVELQQRMRNQRKQPQLQQSHQQQQQRDRIEVAIHPLGGGSKCKRRSKRRRQHKRQRSKKYCR
jgi:paraquat-inducible protein B